MKFYSFETKLKAVSIILAFGLLVHLSLALMAAILENKTSAAEERAFFRQSRLRPRHLMPETEVRGKTYHVHNGRIVDLKAKRIYLERRKNIENMKSHFIARRQILEKDDQELLSENLFYKLIGGEVSSIKLNCQKCSIVGSAGTLTSAETGSVIDNSDCVFRLGAAPVLDYEMDVGSKTTVRIIDGKSFSELLRRPEKLIFGSLSSPNWIVFDHLEVDFLKLNSKIAKLTKMVPQLRIYTMTRVGENRAMMDMKTEASKIGYKLPNAAPSTLWYAIQATFESKCQNVSFFGIPPPKFCKQSLTGRSKSRYWGHSRAPFCSGGKDSGIGPNIAESQLLSLADRRSLLGLVFSNQLTQFNFFAPRWHQSNKT